MAQQIINTGANANDGTGESLREAFTAVNENFTEIYTAGPVGSNVRISGNTITTLQTNQNLTLNPDGIGKIQANATIVPSLDSVYDIGSPTAQFDSVYARYYYGNGAFLTGLTSSSNTISNGSSNVAITSPGGNVTVAVGGVSNVTVFANTGQYINGIVSATGNIIGNNFITNNILGSDLTITSTGNLTLAPTGNITVNNRYITNLADPVQDQDAATKYYVDSVAQGLDPKASVVYATATALPAYTYNNGILGVGATITANAIGALNIDGFTPTANSRVLIKNETLTNAPYNGIYVVTVAGNASAAFQLIRSTDFDIGAEVPSAFVFVESGIVNADVGYVCTTNSPVIMGTTAITWTQFSGAGSYTANTSAGLSLTGSVFNAKVDNNTTAFDGGGNISVKASANLTTPNIGAATGTSLSVSGNIVGGNVITAGIISVASISASGNVTANYFVGNGSVLTSVMADRGADLNNWNSMTQMGVYTVNRTSWSGTVGTPLDSQVFVGLVEVKNSTNTAFAQIYYPGTLEPGNVKIQWNRTYWAGTWSSWIKIVNDEQVVVGGSY